MKEIDSLSHLMKCKYVMIFIELIFLHYPSKETYMHSSSRNNQWVHSTNANSALTLQEIADAMNMTRERVR